MIFVGAITFVIFFFVNFRARGKAPSIRDDYYQMRFTKPKKGAINRYHATRNEELKKRLLHLKNIRKEFQDKKITICRAYRVGMLCFSYII